MISVASSTFFGIRYYYLSTVSYSICYGVETPAPEVLCYPKYFNGWDTKGMIRCEEKETASQKLNPLLKHSL